MSNEAKNNGEYKKPESHDISSDDLENISGGAGQGKEACTRGETPTDSGCLTGGNADQECNTGIGTASCDSGANAYGNQCASGLKAAISCKTGSGTY